MQNIQTPTRNWKAFNILLKFGNFKKKKNRNIDSTPLCTNKNPHKQHFRTILGNYM